MLGAELERLSEEGTLEQRPVGSEEISHVGIRQKSGVVGARALRW